MKVRIYIGDIRDESDPDYQVEEFEAHRRQGMCDECGEHGEVIAWSDGFYGPGDIEVHHEKCFPRDCELIV